MPTSLDELNWVGQSLAGGRYRVTALLGEGGMGSVYRAHDANLDAEVVIKVPKAGFMADKEFAARFAREVRSLVRLAHADVVRVLDVGEHNGLPFAVMQFLPGGNLRDRAMAWPDARAALATLGEWLPDVADALDYIHGQGYVHRDVKPDNILFDQAGHAYLGDFGIIKALAGADGGVQETSFQTSAGLTVGTPPYMAPELITGKGFDARVDQYALAVTIYEVVCARLPFDGRTAAALAVQHSTQQPPPPHEVSGVPLAFSAALLRGLAKDPAARYPDCRSLARALVVPAADVRPAPGPAPPRPAPHGHPCPSCGTMFALPEHAAGKRFRCRHCGAAFQVPAAPPPAPLAETDAVALATTSSMEQAPPARPPDPPPVVRESPPPPPVAPAPPPPAEQKGSYPCPSCGKVFAVSKRLWGKRVRCTRCQTRFVLPGLPSSVPTAGVSVAPAPPEDGPAVNVGQPAKFLTAGVLALVLFLVGIDPPWRPDLAPVSPVRTFEGHTDKVTGAVFSPDGKYALSSSDDRSVRLWEVATGREVRRFNGHRSMTLSVAFSPDGKRAASCSGWPPGPGADYSVRLWDVETGRGLHRMDGHTGPVWRVVFAPDGRHILSGADDHTLRLWDVTTGREVRRFEGHTDGLRGLAIAPDGKRALSGSLDGTMRLWDVETGRQLRRSHCSGGVSSVAFSPDGALAVSGGDPPGPALRLWDVKTGAQVHAFEGHALSVWHVTFTPDGGAVLTSGGDGIVRVWDTKTGRPLRTVRAHSGPVRTVAVSPDGRTFLSASHDRTIGLWPVER